MQKHETGYLRSPSQKRGHQRVQQILDAAAAIISESSLEHLTIQALAKHSRTAPGSLYHFFSDIESVKALLKEGYDNSLNITLDKIKNDYPEKAWVLMEPAEAINNLFLPYANFILENRAYLPLLQQSGFDFRNSRFLHFLTDILASRNAGKREMNVMHEASFMHSMAIGTLQQAFQREKSLPYDFMPRILRTLELYLTHIENTPS